MYYSLTYFWIWLANVGLRIFAPSDEEYWSIIFFSYYIFVWFWYQSNVGLRKLVKCFFHFYFLERIMQNWYCFFLKYFAGFFNKAMENWSFIFERFLKYELNFFNSFRTCQAIQFFLSEVYLFLSFKKMVCFSCKLQNFGHRVVCNILL